uniref:ATP synthase subunit a n=1 Tax=Paralaevicephalus gracilipenis TaxID=1513330 RepID=A0A6B9QEL1_9HEMI|nr:ATP synthase F0 subunit 6 [Paralaevicephalus gracilipenis]
MTNLFSMFDPTTGFLPMNWLSMLIMFMIPQPFWNTPSKPVLLMMKTLNSLMKEVILHLNKIEPTIMLVSMFMFILINNMFGLLPYVFTTTAHLVVSLGMAMSMWMSLMIFGWTKKTNNMFAHLVPVGTPNMLLPFMVMIESISNIIRPGSLAVRLTANMIAGHILMNLLGNNLSQNPTMMILMMWMFMGLLMFETAVAFIQSYVFMTLSTLYSSEI